MDICSKCGIIVHNGHMSIMKGGFFIMPRRDGTGPMGRGFLTGRAFGFCAKRKPGEGSEGLGFGRGLRRGQGLGCRLQQVQKND